jgi:hypothetical protein
MAGGWTALYTGRFVCASAPIVAMAMTASNNHLADPLMVLSIRLVSFLSSPAPLDAYVTQNGS